MPSKRKASTKDSTATIGLGDKESRTKDILRDTLAPKPLSGGLSFTETAS